MNKRNVLKVSLIGSSYCGKTSLVYSCATKTFTVNCPPTVGVDCVVTRGFKDEKEICLDFWDISGDERFKHVALSFVQSSSVIVFCYSATDVYSYEQAVLKHEFFNKKGYLEDKHIILVVTKIDSPKADPDYEKWGNMFSKRHNIPFCKTSAKDNTGINNFINLCSSFYNEDDDIDLETINIAEVIKKKNKRKCFIF